MMPTPATVVTDAPPPSGDLAPFLAALFPTKTGFLNLRATPRFGRSSSPSGISMAWPRSSPRA
jgi:hypothetical protein